MADYACAILVRDGAILLGKRSPHRRSYANCWDVLGGKAEQGETTERALSRELGEEIEIVPIRFEPFEVLGDNGDRGAALYHFFVVTSWDGEPTLANHEHSELRWFDLREARNLDGLALREYPALFDRVAALLAARRSQA